jgi:hypothetical protein
LVQANGAKIANITEIDAQFKSLDEEIRREENAANRPPNTGVLPYCSDVESVPNPANVAESVQRFRTVTQSHLCAKFVDLLAKQKLVYFTGSPWYANQSFLWPLEVGVVSGYVLPLLMGLLGSMTYVLRRYLRSIADRLVTPLDLREYIVRLVLGTVFGVTIGFFASSIPFSSLGAPALAFLAGYGAEVVFRMLDGLAAQFSPAGK